MFNLSRPHLLTLDQLHAWGIYRLARPLCTTDNLECSEGAEFYFEFAWYNSQSGAAGIHGRLSAPDGLAIEFHTPGNTHRELFERTGREWRPVSARQRPPVTDEPPADSAAWGAWLGTQPGFERAAGILAGRYSDSNWGSVRENANVLRHAALRLEQSRPALASWVADRSLDLYHAWMSQATSGGEGPAMQYEVRGELDDLRRLMLPKGSGS